jgi:hypothetical protein
MAPRLQIIKIAESSARLRFVGSFRQAKRLAAPATYTIIERTPIAALGQIPKNSL